MAKKRPVAEILEQHEARLSARVDNREVKDLAAEVARLERVLRNSVYARSNPVSVAAPKRHKGGQRVATFVAVASDWHVGELVDPKKVSGLNAYDQRIAEFRSQRFFAAIEHLIRHHRKAQFDIRDMVLVIAGDMITGWIHEELMASNPDGPVKESMFAHALLSAGLTFLRQQLDGLKIRVVCQIGNHGRFTKKVMASQATNASFEWMMYHYLAQAHPECDWQIEEGRHSISEIYGLRLHTHHLDTVKSGGGIGGILVPLNRAATYWREKYGVHHTVGGHFHQLTMTPKLTVNGSLIGYSSYADSLPSAAPEPAQQASFIVDAKRGICHATPLWVSDPSEERKIWRMPK